MSNKQQDTSKPLSRAILDITLANMFSNPAFSQSYLFYAHLISMCSVQLRQMDYAAGVSFDINHYTLHINPELFDKYTLEERLFILQHEMLHILNNHVGRLGERNHEAFNIASDCAINQLCNKNHVIQGAITPSNFPSKKKVPEGASAEQYYEYLEINEDKGPKQSIIGQGGGHDGWGNSTGNDDLKKDITKNMIEKAINETQKSRGDVPNEISAYLELHSRKAELDWKKLLRFVTGNKKANTRKTILRRDRRNPDFEHIKGKTKDRMFDLLLISDVSGSVSDKALYSLWGEIRHICKITQSGINLIQVDAEAYPPEKLKSTTKIFPRKACGGTYLYPAVEYAHTLKLPYNAIVITTDGELSVSDVEQFAKLQVPIIWLIESTGTIIPQMNQAHMRAFQLKS